MVFRLHFLAVVACALALPALAASRPAVHDGVLHLALSKSAPAADEVLASPRELRLWYAEAPVEGLTSVQLSDADGNAVPIGEAEADPADPKLVVFPLRGTLAPGRYVVAWSTVGADDHDVFGRFSYGDGDERRGATRQAPCRGGASEPTARSRAPVVDRDLGGAKGRCTRSVGRLDHPSLN